MIPISSKRAYRRSAGEALSAEREPIEVLESLKLQLGSDAFSAQYQQEPVPPGGAMVKRHWVKRYTELPPHPERASILQSWDTAMKGGPDNDWSVCTTWVLCSRTRWYLIDLWRGRVDYPALKAKAEELAKKWGAQRVLVEDTGAGTSLGQELRGKVWGIIAVKPEGDKVSRMSVASAKIEAGQVFLPEQASWLSDFESELFAFPAGRHDDQCDSVSQALQSERGSWMDLTPEQWERILARSREPSPWRNQLSRSQFEIPCFFSNRFGS